MANAEKKPFNIVLAEDNHGDVILLRKSFEKSHLPHEMRVSNDGAGVFELIVDAYNNVAWPDIFILDIKMPRANGFQVLQVLKK